MEKKKDLNKTKPKRLRGDFIQWKVEATPPLPNPSNEKKVIVNTCVWGGGGESGEHLCGEMDG